MRILVFGNLLFAKDSAALQLLPCLRKEFPSIEFREYDAVEELDEEGEELVILDSVKGIGRVEVFDSLDHFVDSPRYSLHDFDLLTYLKLLWKLGKLKKVTIIGIPVSSKPETGNRKPATPAVSSVACPVNRKRGTGNSKPVTPAVSSKPETGNRKLETGNGQLLSDLVSAIREIRDGKKPEKDNKKR